MGPLRERTRESSLSLSLSIYLSLPLSLCSALPSLSLSLSLSAVLPLSLCEGFGMTNSTVQSMPDVLMKVKVPIVTDGECVARMRASGSPIGAVIVPQVGSRLEQRAGHFRCF